MPTEQANNELYVRRALSRFACMPDTVFCMLLHTVLSLVTSSSYSLQRSICVTLLARHQFGAAAQVQVVSRSLTTLSMSTERLLCNY